MLAGQHEDQRPVAGARTGAGHDTDSLLRNLGVALSIQTRRSEAGGDKTLRSNDHHVVAVEVCLANFQALTAQVGVGHGEVKEEVGHAVQVQEIRARLGELGGAPRGSAR